MNIFYEKFSSGQLIKATGITNHTLQSWMKRNIILGQKETSVVEGGGSPGRHRRFTFHNLMEVATAKALIDCGVTDLKVAFSAARTFAHVGSGPVSGRPQRKPGLLYCSTPESPGYTLLCLSGEKTFVSFWQPGTDPLPEIRKALTRPMGFVVLEMNELFDRVAVCLGYDPKKILEFAYLVHRKESWDND